MFSTNEVDFSRDAFPSGGVAAALWLTHHGLPVPYPLSHTQVPPPQKKLVAFKEIKESDPGSLGTTTPISPSLPKER